MTDSAQARISKRKESQFWDWNNAISGLMVAQWPSALNEKNLNSEIETLVGVLQRLDLILL